MDQRAVIVWVFIPSCRDCRLREPSLCRTTMPKCLTPFLWIICAHCYARSEEVEKALAVLEPPIGLVDHPCRYGKDPCACQVRCNEHCTNAHSLCKKFEWCSEVTRNANGRIGTLKQLAPAWSLSRERRPSIVAIIGEQKTGTTLLFESFFVGRKELHFFDSHRAITQCRLKYYRPRGVDATPDYLADPVAALFFAATFPEARILVVTRQPIERAHAAWDQNRRSGAEGRSFDEAVEAELPTAQRCAGIAANLPTNNSHILRNYSAHCLLFVDRPRNCWANKQYSERPACKRYLHKGFYGHHLSVWVQFYPKIAHLNSPSIFRYSDDLLFNNIATFFQLPLLRRPTYSCWHDCVSPKQKFGVRPDLQRQLIELYAPSQRRLFRILHSDRILRLDAHLPLIDLSW